jgi:hypothetical protein
LSPRAFTDQSGLLPNGATERELDLIQPDGSGRRTILRELAIFAPASSLDSTHLAFEWYTDRVLRIETISLDGSDRRDVAQAYGPVFWSAAGLVINPLRHGYGTVVAVADPETGRTRTISPISTGRSSKRYGARAVAVSPGGHKVVYFVGRFEPDPVFGLRMVNIDGRNDRGLLDCFGTNRPERIVGLPLGDVVDAKAGDDVLLVHGGGIDTVHCGPGRDLVYADRRDLVYADRNDHVAPDREGVTWRR